MITEAEKTHLAAMVENDVFDYYAACTFLVLNRMRAKQPGSPYELRRLIEEVYKDVDQQVEE